MNKTKIYTRIQTLFMRFRSGFWKFFMGSFGEKSRVFGKIIVYRPENVFFGNNSTLNVGCVLNARDKITIGDYVHISPGCIINTGSLDYRKIMDERVHIKKPVIICDGVWVGSGVIINPGVIVGKNSVIGAGAVVTKNIPEGVVAAGVPAVVLRSIGV